VSGATRQGVSLIAGDVAEDESFRAIGYLPASVPDEVHVDDERYAELRRTTGEVFSVAEPLQYWSDVVVSEIAAAEVRLLAIGGGQISPNTAWLWRSARGSERSAAAEGRLPSFSKISGGRRRHVSWS
jgi:hypothetical protein